MTLMTSPATSRDLTRGTTRVTRDLTRDTIPEALFHPPPGFARILLNWCGHTKRTHARAYATAITHDTSVISLIDVTEYESWR